METLAVPETCMRGTRQALIDEELPAKAQQGISDTTAKRVREEIR